MIKVIYTLTYKSVKTIFQMKNVLEKDEFIFYVIYIVQFKSEDKI